MSEGNGAAQCGRRSFHRRVAFFDPIDGRAARKRSVEKIIVTDNVGVFVNGNVDIVDDGGSIAVGRHKGDRARNRRFFGTAGGFGRELNGVGGTRVFVLILIFIVRTEFLARRLKARVLRCVVNIAAVAFNVIGGIGEIVVSGFADLNQCHNVTEGGQ